jgi:FKBP-type peptidyl-prolyl cis-trans isomerase FkpA
MKKIFLGLSICAILFSACKKQDAECPYSPNTASATTAERDALRTILSNASITTTEHSSGVFYNITVPGTGANPDVCSNITVKYTGSLVSNGQVFDSNASTSGTTFTLGNLIAGWQAILPLVKAGGKVTMYIPPSLGYGQQNVRDNAGNLVIPGNSNLKFEMELLNVQ